LSATLLLLLLGLMLTALLLEWAEPDVLVSGCVLVLALVGVLDVEQALLGLANKGVLTVACLFVVAQALSQSGVLDRAASRLLSSSVAGEEPRWPLLRLSAALASLSAFVNNTPLIMMTIPAVRRIAKLRGLKSSTVLMPLSFATILGGTATLLGTSTNLVLSGMLSERGLAPLGLFETAAIGLPLTVLGLLYLRLAAPRLLPSRDETEEELRGAHRDFVVELQVKQGYDGLGRTVEQAGLRNLSGLFLFGIERAKKTLVPVPPDELLHEDDVLLLVGKTESLNELLATPGLVATDTAAFRRGEGGTRVFEAVMSHRSPLLGKTVRDSGFRGMYGAAILAIHRHGERLEGKVGDQVLKMGDTLLLVSDDTFDKRADPSHFFGVVQERTTTGTDRQRPVLAVSVVAAAFLAMALGWMSPLEGAFSAAVVLVVSGCLSAQDARRAIDIRVVVFLGMSISLGLAVEKVGLADLAAQLVLSTVQSSVTGAIALVFFGTAVLSAVASNQAAAVVALPVALAVAEALGVDPRCMVLTVVFAASCSFATPTSYQTNLLVWGPGNYKAADYVRLGLPLSVGMWVFCTAVLSALYDPAWM